MRRHQSQQQQADQNNKPITTGVNTERDVGLTTTMGHPNPGSTATITDGQPISTTNTESITGDKTNPYTTITTTTSTNTVGRGLTGLTDAQVPTLKTVTSSGTSEVTTRHNSGSGVSVNNKHHSKISISVETLNLFTTIHDGNFRRHSSMNVTIK